MKKTAHILGLLMMGLTMISSAAMAAEEITVKPKYSTACVLGAIAPYMKVKLSQEIALPEVLFASEVKLEDYQNDVEKQWGMRPSAIVNIYLFEKNRIYLNDEEKYYTPKGRFIDDSLAHELAHYIQVKYKKAQPGNDEMLEMEAVYVQTWFRDTYMTPGASPCP